MFKLVLLRNDFRLLDNQAIFEACEDGSKVLFVYITDESYIYRLGNRVKSWLKASIIYFKEKLDKMGFRLVVLDGDAIKILNQLIDKYNIEQVYWNRGYTERFKTFDDNLTNLLIEKGIYHKSCKGNVVLEPWIYCKTYKMYLPFWQKFHKNLGQIGIVSPNFQGVGNLDIEESDNFSQIDKIPNLLSAWNVGEDFAIDMLDNFVQHKLHVYEDNKNMLSQNFTSTLSPYINMGNISVKYVWNRCVDSTSFCNGLAIRDYANHLSYNKTLTTRTPKEDHRRYNTELFERWCNGQTGNKIIDAGMRHLLQYGWINNRMRMLAASFLMYTYKIPMEYGVLWFFDNLVDADESNNLNGWQTMAGTGSPAGNIIFNIDKQTEMYDKSGDYRKRWCG